MSALPEKITRQWVLDKLWWVATVAAIVGIVAKHGRNAAVELSNLPELVRGQVATGPSPAGNSPEEAP